MKALRESEVKLSGSDTRTCCWLTALSEAPQRFYTGSHQHIQVDGSVLLLWVKESVCVLSSVYE